MGRVEKIMQYIDDIFLNIINSDERKVAFIHSYGVAQCCSLLAVKRGLNSELAFVCGLLHDVYAYKTGVRKLHSINGAEMIRVAFKYKLKDVFTNEEQTLIKSAIFHHSDKEHIHDEYDEILKDADVLQHWLFDVTSDYFVCERLIEVQKELNLPISKLPKHLEVKNINSFSRIMLGNLAEELAQKNIHGEKSDSEFMDIIKFYPESSAFDELQNAWCAAFVYYCAVKAGLEMPIRFEPMANTRFACVAAWLRWGEKNGFCFREQDGFIPSRGDILIYDNIIPKENKPANTPWYDHIGIVLSVDDEYLTVGEGNINNNNISGVTKRKRGENIGCYLRIPDGYKYDGWMYDYKTQKIRMQNY